MDFIRDFEEKVSQIEKYFQFVYLIENINAIENILSLKKSYVVLKTIKRYPLKKYISQDGKYAIEAELRKILKANAYLILYNLVEGALNSAMNEYFESFSSKRKRYKKFKPFIKKLWIEYKHKSFKNKKAEDIMNIIESIIDEVIKIEDKIITENGANRTISNYDAFKQEVRNNEISGNIDARKIRELAMQYGFLLPANSQCDSLLTIKSNRNKLAHGEASFIDIGKESIENIILAKNESIAFMRNVLKKIEKTIITNHYMQ